MKKLNTSPIGFVIINGGTAEPLPSDLFDAPSKIREHQIIKYMTKSLKIAIQKKILLETYK